MKKTQPSYEQAVAELEEILAQLAADTTPLDTALTLYARAAQLIEHCDKTLKQAALQMQTVSEALQALQPQPGEGDDDGQ